MKKIIYVIIVIAIVGLAINLLGNRANQDKDLAKEIDSFLEKGVTQIDLTEVAQFPWTQVSLFEPYTTNESIEASMNIQFKGDNGGIDMLDDRFLLVFADEKNAVRTVVLSREHGTYTIKNNKFLIINW